MKLIVKKEELDALQSMYNTITDKVVELGIQEIEDYPNVMQALQNLKDKTHVHYRLICGDFIVTIDSEAIIDGIKLSETMAVRSLPVFKALIPVIEMVPGLVEGFREDILAYIDTYSD